MRAELPTGTVTFLFTDVEGSTSLLNELGAERYADALADHRAVIREACTENGGVEVDTQGDAFFFVFPTAPGALDAASEFTDHLAADGQIRVRVGVHTGTPLLGDEGYVGHDVHRAARIAAGGHGGQVLVSASTASLVDAELTDLGDHRFKDLGAAERVFQLGTDEFPGLKSLHRTNLPVPATPFLGREHELRDVVELLAKQDTRLVTLTGAGGSGKTRLTLQAAAEASDGFPDGVVWIPLAPLRDVSVLASTFAQALEVRERPDLSLEDSIVAAFGSKRALIVADNCEHVLGEVTELVRRLIEGCPTLVVLASSRERLGLRAERVYEVPPMAPADGHILFVERATAIDAGFRADENIAAICEAVDELPLAIELAAARVRSLSTAAICDRLTERLALLVSANRDVDERQRTLEATIAWSYDLLDHEQQRMLRGLSVFAGGCTLAAAEAVTGAELESLESLIDKSLIRHRIDEAGRDRYWMLETIRQFAREELERTGDLNRVRDAHAYWYASDTTERAHGIRREDPSAITWVGSEIDNLRAALTTFLERKQADEAVALAANLSFYFNVAGAHQELVDLVARIEALDPAPSSGLARLQRRAADSAGVLGDAEAWADMLEAAAATAVAAGDEVERLATALRQGQVLYRQGDAAGARALMEPAIAGLRDLADNRGLASGLYTYGITLIEEPKRALPLLTEALEISRNEGLEFGIAASTQGLGWAHGLLGNHAVALALGAESAARFAELGDREGVSYSLGNCAQVLAGLGDTHFAAALLAVAGRIRSELGIPQHEPDQEETRARLEQSLGQSRVAELMSSADALSDGEAIRLATEASQTASDADSATTPL